MSRLLMIMRHAKSGWDTDDRFDFSRPLSGRGQRSVAAMSEWMQQSLPLPGRIVSSPAMRCHQTVVGLCEGLGTDPSRVVWDEQLYLASRETLVATVVGTPAAARSLLLVAHNPGIEALVSWLAAPETSLPAGDKLMPTGALVVFELGCDWRAVAAGCGSLLVHQRPRLLE